MKLQLWRSQMGSKCFVLILQSNAKEPPLWRKFLKASMLITPVQEDITVAAFMHLTLVFWILGRNCFLSRSKALCIYHFSVKWEVLNKIYKKWIRAQTPDSGSRLQDQTLGCRSQLRGSRLSIIHTSSVSCSYSHYSCRKCSHFSWPLREGGGVNPSGQPDRFFWLLHKTNIC